MMEGRWKCKNYLCLARLWTRISVRHVRTMKNIPLGCTWAGNEAVISARQSRCAPGSPEAKQPTLLVLRLFLKGEETHVVALLPAEVCLSICLLVARSLTKEPETIGSISSVSCTKTSSLTEERERRSRCRWWKRACSRAAGQNPTGRSKPASRPRGSTLGELCLLASGAGGAR